MSETKAENLYNNRIRSHLVTERQLKFQLNGWCTLDRLLVTEQRAIRIVSGATSDDKLLFNLADNLY